MRIKFDLIQLNPPQKSSTSLPLPPQKNPQPCMAVGFLFYINPHQNSSTSLPLPPKLGDV